MKIRNFTMDDYEVVYTIWKSRDLSLGISDTKDEVLRVSDLFPDLFLVAEKNGIICGSVMGAFDGRRGYVHHLAVSQNFTNRNIGKMLMNELELRLKNMGVVKIHLFVEKRNSKVVDYYKELKWHTRDDLIMMSKNSIT